MYEEMIKYVKYILQNTDANAVRLCAKFPFRSRFEHTMRVYKWAMRINAAENGDAEILSIAAIFHDAGKGTHSEKPHAVIGAEICEAYLKSIDYPEDRRIRVVKAISLHSSKSRTNLDLSLEDKILMDADMLDEVGALAVLWDSMATALGSEPGYFKAYERHLKFYKNLKNHQRLLKTEEGARLYAERLDFLKLFIENLAYELGL